MISQFDYVKENEKLQKNKLEWEKFKKEQELRQKLESNILMNIEETLLKQNYNNNNNLSNESNELESIKLLYQKKLKT